MNDVLRSLQHGYDAIADEYVARIYHELEHKPLDRILLDRYAEAVRGLGRVCELGCGPGHVARYLSERSVDIFGLDLSPRLVERARQLNPGLEFQPGNLLALEADDGAWGGIVAFYSIIHIPRDQMTQAFQGFWRVLRRNGLLLLAFHVGTETIHRDEWWGKTVSIDTMFFQPAEITAALNAAGFVVEDVIERPPYEGVEYPSQRAYIFARKPENTIVA